MATEFQIAVWNVLKTIPRGRVTTYQDVACALGNSHASRAVGSACGKNPNLVSVPCHRVVASSGQVGHYVGGINKKSALLREEGIVVNQGRIQDFKTVRFSWRK